MGPSIATQIILNSRFVSEFKVIHIDTADRRPLNNLGKLDVINIYLALKHYFLLLLKLLFVNVDLVYIPISQTTIGFLRDLPFVLLAKLFRKKVVLHLRGGYFGEFYNLSNGVIKYIIQKTLKRVNRMIVLGNSLKILFDGLIDEDKLSVVPNGLNLSTDEIGYKSYDENHLKILFLSNLIETKGFKDVLYSIKKVAECYDNVKYIFAGAWRKDKDKPECENYLKKGNYTGGQ